MGILSPLDWREEAGTGERAASLLGKDRHPVVMASSECYAPLPGH